MKGEWYGMGYDFDDAGDAFAEALGAGRIQSRGSRVVSDKGEQILADLDQEREALALALARNTMAREQVLKQQEQKLALGEDVYREGDVVRWRKQFRDRIDGNLGETVYTYAAVKLSDGQWAVTGTTQKRLSWNGLRAFMIARGRVVDAYIMEVIPGRKLV